jgi:hypothetical protein
MADPTPANTKIRVAMNSDRYALINGSNAKRVIKCTKSYLHHFGKSLEN